MLDDERNVFQNTFFYHLPNHLGDFLPSTEEFEARLRVLKVDDYRKKHHLKVVMDAEKGLAIGFISAN